MEPLRAACLSWLSPLRPSYSASHWRGVRALRCRVTHCRTDVRQLRAARVVSLGAATKWRRRCDRRSGFAPCGPQRRHCGPNGGSRISRSDPEPAKSGVALAIWNTNRSSNGSSQELPTPCDTGGRTPRQRL